MVPPLTLCAYMKKGPNLRWSLIQCSGGDEGDRTPDLLTASQALSQLSYAPVRRSTIRELGRRCKDNFGKYFAGGEGTQPGRGCRRGNGPRGPAMPFSPSGRAPRAAALPPPSSPAPLGHLESRGPPFLASAARSAIRPTAVLPAPGPLSGPTAPPAHPTIPKPCRFTGPGREPPSMAQSVKSKPQVDDSHIPRNAVYGRPVRVQPRNPT